MPVLTRRKKEIRRSLLPKFGDIEIVKAVREAVDDAKKKRALANTAEAKEAAAQARVRQARTKIELQRAKADLKTAKMERQRRELVAKTALEKAKAGLARAKAEHQQASTEKWRARFGKIQAATGGAQRLVKGITSGGGSLREMVVGSDAPKNRKQRKAEKRYRDSLMDW